ncbi:acyl transferase/acyl hydrolase/lysophospholipase [Zychaea mexicana]|uniref:acyl transferase/acyl hydrolase/lysophospholipase n=1 Tax=Zychaea mexicana TaxID=64656 RepID=UPI0022FE7173|nr:acyl transferase/acyl hydrolase/lysophospholipase [Zychaea mexicana]KAI9488610.1 acyl transferase/acyl hydrolase/lysophospholipase [Zychaea mexicana]
MTWRYCWRKTAVPVSFKPTTLVIATAAAAAAVTSHLSQNHTLDSSITDNNNNNTKRRTVVELALPSPPTLPLPARILSRTLSITLAEQQQDNNNNDKKISSFSSVDELISRLFARTTATSDNNKSSNSSPLPTTTTLPAFKFPKPKEVEETISRLYPALATQMENIRESYAKFWDFLTMDEFRHMVETAEKEAKDPMLHPEVDKDAAVRVGSGLCDQELAFIEARKKKQKEAFARFIGVSVRQVELEDIPVVGMAASGGGFRAMIGVAGYMKAMQDTGLLDLVMYAAGVSGSCWTLAQQYSPLTEAKFDILLDHLKSHTHVHLANVNNFVAILNASPKNRELMMQGIIERYYQQNEELNIVDVFGLLLGSVLLTKNVHVNNSEKADEDEDKEQGKVKEESGSMVKPILLDRNAMKMSKQTKYFQDGSMPMPIYCVVRIDEEDGHDKDLYQWYEFTPFEMGTEELNAWIPVWAFGRRFSEGKNTQRLPEQTLGIMMGVFGSAFAASLAHFYKEIRGFMPTTAVEKADEMIVRFKDSMSGYYPISPACFPNPFYRLSVPHDAKDDGLVESKQLALADAGLDNNIPFYPLLREGRNADVILAIDLSADIQTSSHFDRAEGYVQRRGISGWPKGAGWPKKSTDDSETSPSLSEESLGTCTVFASKTYDDEEEESEKPITVVYFPLISNPNHDSTFDPQTAEFTSTWNFVYSSTQVSKLVGLAERNLTDNVDQVRQVLRQVWQRKRAMRLRKENKEDVFRIA